MQDSNLKRTSLLLTTVTHHMYWGQSHNEMLFVCLFQTCSFHISETELWLFSDSSPGRNLPKKILWCPSLKWLPALFGPKYSLCLAQKKRAAGHNAHSRGLKAWYNPGKGSKRCSSADSLPLRWKIDISGRSTFDHILTVIANSVLIKKLTMIEEAAERWFTTLVIVSIILWESNCSCYNVLE